MRRISIALSICFAVLFVAGTAMAQESLVKIVADGCKKELASYCKDVTPGNGRVLACLYAHEDKLSNRCEYALYDASAQLQHAVAALAYLASECRQDLKTFCSSVKPGEGRLIECIDKNKDKISARCKQAIKDVNKD
jgi:hypothetical protein